MVRRPLSYSLFFYSPASVIIIFFSHPHTFHHRKRNVSIATKVNKEKKAASKASKTAIDTPTLEIPDFSLGNLCYDNDDCTKLDMAVEADDESNTNGLTTKVDKIFSDGQSHLNKDSSSVSSNHLSLIHISEPTRPY